MTLATLGNRTSQSGDGVATVFNFPNKFLLNADLVVLRVVDLTGAETTQVLDTDYTVAGAGNPAGGTVTFIIAPPPATDTVVIFRDPAKTQAVDLVEGDPLPVDASVETPFDKLTMIVQRICDTLARTLHLTDGDPTNTTLFFLPTLVDRADKFLAFDANGIPKADADIPKWITGNGVPAASLGNNGDMYIDLLTGDLYGPKTAGAWGALIANFTGPTVITTVFGRIGAIVAAASDYDASQVDNDSGVAGAFVSNALDTLNTAIGAITHPITTVFGRAGVVIAAASDYDASQVDNDSGVVGAFVSNALDTLNTAIGAITHPITTVFGRSGVVVAAASDYDASQIDNDSGVVGAFVDDALNTLDTSSGTKEMWIPVTRKPTSNSDEHPLSVAYTLAMGFAVPSDFATLVSATIVGRLEVAINTTAEFAYRLGRTAPTEVFTDSTNELTGNQFVVTVATHDETYFELDIGSVFTNVAGSDYCRIELNEAPTSTDFSYFVRGLLLKYTT